MCALRYKKSILYGHPYLCKVCYVLSSGLLRFTEIKEHNHHPMPDNKYTHMCEVCSYESSSQHIHNNTYHTHRCAVAWRPVRCAWRTTSARARPRTCGAAGASPSRTPANVFRKYSVHYYARIYLISTVENTGPLGGENIKTAWILSYHFVQFIHRRHFSKL